MGQSPIKSLPIQTIHFFATLRAYTKFEALKFKCGLVHFRLKSQLYAVGLKAIYHQIALLTA